jgi:hypothetical protein
MGTVVAVPSAVLGSKPNSCYHCAGILGSHAKPRLEVWTGLRIHPTPKAGSRTMKSGRRTLPAHTELSDCGGFACVDDLLCDLAFTALIFQSPVLF